MEFADRPRLNPNLVIREEDDNYAILFDPDANYSYVLNPVSLFLCRQLDGSRSLRELVELVRENFSHVPDEVEQDVGEFVTSLLERRLAELVE